MKFKWLFAMMAALVLVISTGAAAFAAPQAPAQCEKGAFTWQCTSGSEKFANEPAPPISGLGGNGYFESQFFSNTGFGGNAYVQTGSSFALRFKTHQEYVSWWDAKGTLNVVKQLNGSATIPSGAVLIGIPLDVMGNFDLPGWVKGKLTTTGEYVLGAKAWLK